MSFVAINLRRIIKTHSKYLQPKYNLITRCCSNEHQYLIYDKDPGPSFINDETQKLLKSITRLDLDKIYRKRSVPKNSVEYKFMTTEQLEDELLAATEKAEHFLQMPPVVKILNEEHKVIHKDPALSMFSDTSYVFTDITYGLKALERTMVIRLPDGTLEKAPHNIHKRVNLIYFPITGRKMQPSKLFDKEYLNQCLDKFNYEYILDRLCLQFEPYEKEFHSISSKVYMHIKDNKNFDCLRSTRHFGPMAFFLCWHKLIDDLLIDMIKRDYLLNGVELIILAFKLNNIEYDNIILEKLVDIQLDKKELIKKYTLCNDIHVEIEKGVGKSSNDFKNDDICIEFINEFIQQHSLKRPQLEITMQTYKEVHEQKRNLLEGLQKAHGIN